MTMNRFFVIVALFLLTSCSQEPVLKPLPATGVVLAFGDSLTFGTGASTNSSYPAVLEQLIGRRVINAGIPGEISADGLKRLSGLLLDTQPDLVILIHDGNDMLRRFNLQTTARNLKAMIELCRKQGAQVVMLGVPKPGLILASATIYASVSEETGTPIDDEVIADILQYSANKSDPVHPNSKGYRILAESIRDLLIETGAVRD